MPFKKTTFVKTNSVIMGASLEARKLSILEYLAEGEDEAVIMQIENLLKPKIDIWNELSEQEKSIITQGQKDLDERKRILFKEFLAKRNWHLIKSWV